MILVVGGSTGSSGENVLRAEGLVKRFSSFMLGPIDLVLQPGTTCGLLGANASGKTTLLNCLAGQYRPTEGNVFVGNESIRFNAHDHRFMVALFLERVSLYGDLTVSQILAFVSRLYPRWNHRLVQEWTRGWKLPLDQRLKTVSKGTQVKVALICTVASGAEWLLLDEPTAGLDPESRWEVQEFLSLLGQEGNTGIVLASHLFEDIERVAEHVLVIRQGQIVWNGPLVDLVESRIFCFDQRVAPELDGAIRRVDLPHLGATWFLVRDFDALTPEVRRSLLRGQELPAQLSEIYFALQGISRGRGRLDSRNE